MSGTTFHKRIRKSPPSIPRIESLSVEKNDLQKLFEKYIKECEFSGRLRPATIRGYQAVFYLFSMIMPEVIEPGSLSFETMTEFFKRLQTRERVVGRDTLKSGVRDSTIKTYWNKLNAFFNWLLEESIIEKNPFENKKPPQPVYEDNRAFEDEEIHKIISAITSNSKSLFLLKRDLMMIYLLICCGVRLGEFSALELRDIDMERKLLTIRGETSKSKKPRFIPIHATLFMYLNDYLAQRKKLGYKTQYLTVSTKSDRGLSCQGLRHWVKSLQKKSGVKVHMHRFRHTFACKLANEDVGPFKIQKLMGHSSLAMTSRYVRSLRNEDLADDIGKISI